MRNYTLKLETKLEEKKVVRHKLMTKHPVADAKGQNNQELSVSSADFI